MEGSGMIEAGAVFAALLAALRVIEKLVDKKMNNGNEAKAVQIDLNQGELANNMGQMVECLAATGQTLERINDKIDDTHEKTVRIESLTTNINRVTTETGGNVFKIINDLEKAEAKEQGRREALAEQQRAGGTND
jgi:DNA anti-recombination protein RmuC